MSLETFGEYRDSLKTKCERVSEGSDGGSRGLLQQVYTELYITEVRVQHEVSQTKTGSREKNIQERVICCRDFFKPLPTEHQQGAFLRVVLTVGLAGAGKTFSVLKFCLDWAQGSENQKLELVVPLSFREMNLVSRGRYSLMELIHVFHPTLQPLTPQALTHSKVLFICDGLNESCLTLDYSCEVISEVTQRSEVSVLLVNLIRGDLLPEALIWITSRPAVASQIPVQYVHRVTEVQGFSTDLQKETFFMKKFSEKQLQKVLSHLRTSWSLHTMCQIPLFCWMTSTVLDHMLRTDQSGPLLQTLTGLYAHFLLVQILSTQETEETGLMEMFKHFNISETELTSADCELLLKLGRLAFEQLQRRNVLFYQEDLEQVGLDLTEASVYFRQESTIFNKPVYGFIHLSFQEFMAAVYVHHSFRNNSDVVKDFLNLDEKTIAQLNPKEFLRRSLLKSLQSPNGHLDLFVRFLFGLSLEPNQKLLGCLLSPVEQSEIPKVIGTLTIMNDKGNRSVSSQSPDRSINIFHCQMELKDQSVLQQIQDFLSSGDPSQPLSETHCSAVAYMLQMSEQVLEELDLSKYNTTVQGRWRLIPAARNCRSARLRRCGLTYWACDILNTALRSNPSNLRVLDLSENPELEDLGVEHLRDFLQDPHGRLETLRLRRCGLTYWACDILNKALRSNPSNLRVLDLSENPELKDLGVRQLHDFLQDPRGRLETLRLRRCGLTDMGCYFLNTALRSNPSNLRVLDLSENPELEDLGVEYLRDFLQDPHGRLETLSLESCGLSDLSCEYLASALKSHPSPTLKELNLQNNNLTSAGVRELQVVQTGPGNTLDIISSSPWTGRGKSSDPTPPLSKNKCEEPQPGPSHCESMAGTVHQPQISRESRSLLYRLRCPSSGAFCCSSTGLVFVVTKKVELQYRIIQWDEGLLQSSGRTPAGPLYDIECPENVVCELHLPHCEPQTDVSRSSLSVAHVTDTGVTFLEPLRITESHVVIQVSGLSLFGLVWQILDWISLKIKSVSGQVLLFLSDLNFLSHLRKLNVLLLPKNVPVDEVQPKYLNMKNIQVPGRCTFTVNQSYRLTCPGAQRLQPETSPFILDYGPNFHPMFEIRLTEQMTLIHVSVSEETSTAVWEHDVDLTDVIAEELPQSLSLASAQRSFRSLLVESSSTVNRRLSSMRLEFVERVSEAVLDQLLDRLLQSGVLTGAERERAANKERRERAALLIDSVRNKGSTASRLFIMNLNDLDLHLLQDLMRTTES